MGQLIGVSGPPAARRLQERPRVSAAPLLSLPSAGRPDVRPDIRPARLAAEQYAQLFADATPRLSRSQALVEAERCLYCYDAPCVTACPTGIDVPSFIRRIANDNLRGAGQYVKRPPFGAQFDALARKAALEAPTAVAR
jgi:ferredoxin